MQRVEEAAATYWSAEGVEKARAKVAWKEAEHELKKVALNLARADKEGLVELGGGTTVFVPGVAKAEAEVAEAKAEVAEARAEVAEAKVEVAEAKVEVAKAEAEVAKAEWEEEGKPETGPYADNYAAAREGRKLAQSRLNELLQTQKAATKKKFVKSHTISLTTQ